MTKEQEERLMEIIEELKEILPEFDAFMLSEESLIMTSYENLKDAAEMMGFEDLFIDEEVDYDPYDIDPAASGNNDDEEGGGLLH